MRILILYISAPFVAILFGVALWSLLNRVGGDPVPVFVLSILNPAFLFLGLTLRAQEIAHADN